MTKTPVVIFLRSLGFDFESCPNVKHKPRRVAFPLQWQPTYILDASWYSSMQRGLQACTLAWGLFDWCERLTILFHHCGLALKTNHGMSRWKFISYQECNEWYMYQNISSILMDIHNMYIRMEYQEYHVSRHIKTYQDPLLAQPDATEAMPFSCCWGQDAWPATSCTSRPCPKDLMWFDAWYYIL